MVLIYHFGGFCTVQVEVPFDNLERYFLRSRLGDDGKPGDKADQSGVMMAGVVRKAQDDKPQLVMRVSSTTETSSVSNSSRDLLGTSSDRL